MQQHVEYRRVVDEYGDVEGTRGHSCVDGGSQSADFSPEMEDAAIFGFFANAMVGSPEYVVEQLQAMRDDGLDGAAISLVDYEEGNDQFAEALGPLIVGAGLCLASLV